MRNQVEKANDLADRAIANPSLMDAFSDETMIKFTLSVYHYTPEKAQELMVLKYGHAKGLVHFWEAVGILIPTEEY